MNAWIGIKLGQNTQNFIDIIKIIFHLYYNQFYYFKKNNIIILNPYIL